MKKYSLEIFTIIMIGMIIYCAVSYGHLCSIQRIVMAYMILFTLHELEENRFPGGFAELMAKFFGLNITQDQERLSHIPVYALLFVITMVPFFTKLPMLVLVPIYLGLFEAIIHVVGIRIHKMKKPYTPGMVTALLLGAASVMVLIICSEKHLVQGPEYVWGVLLMFVCFALMQRTVIAIFGLGYKDLIANVKLKIKSKKIDKSQFAGMTKLKVKRNDPYMSVDIREATSKEIQKNIQVVKRMTKGMSFDENMGNVNWRMVRLISNFGYKFMPKAKGVSFKTYREEGCRYEVALPKEMTGNNVICYIHGGGFVSGSASSSRGYSSMLAVTSGLRVFSVDYDLAPEHPFPAGFNNCCAVINEIRRLYPDSKIALVGESAGANLCIAVALKMKDKVSSVIVHSPFVDFTGSLERSEHEIDDFTVKEGCLKPLNDIYVAGNNAMEPYISPMYGDFNGFPPTFITCDYNETLFADSIWLYRKLQENGIKVKMIQMKGAFQAFATTGTQAPETATILKENVEFIKENMACYNSF